MSLPMADEALDLGDFFLVFFDGIGVSTCCKRVVATTILSALLVPKTSLLVVLVLLASLALVGRKLLVLAIRCVSNRSFSRLSLS